MPPSSSSADPAHAIGIAGKADSADHRAEVFARIAADFGRARLPGQQRRHQPRLRQGPATSATRPCARSSRSTCSAAWPGAGTPSPRGSSTAIVNIASIAGVTAAPGIALYGVSKAALINLTTQLAYELAPGIRVNAVAPAVIKTDFAKALYEGREEQVAATYPLKRLGVADGCRRAGRVPALRRRRLDHRPDPGHRRRRLARARCCEVTDGADQHRARCPSDSMRVSVELFAQHGYAQTSVQQIVDAAGVTKGALYHYFKSKDDLLFDIYDRLLSLQREHLDEIVARGPRPRSRHAAGVRGRHRDLHRRACRRRGLLPLAAHAEREAAAARSNAAAANTTTRSRPSSSAAARRASSAPTSRRPS